MIYYMQKGMDVVLRDIETDQILAAARANTEVSIEYSVEDTEQKGGLNGTTLFKTKTNEELTMTFNSISWTPEFYALLGGNPNRIGEFELEMLPQKTPVVGGKITLEHEPMGKVISIVKDDVFISIPVEAGVKEYDVSGYDVDQNCVEVVYNYMADAIHSEIGGSEARTVKAVGTNVVYNDVGEKVAIHQWTIPRFKLNGSFTEAYNATSGDPVTFAISGTALAATSEACTNDNIGTILGYVDTVYLNDKDIREITTLVARPSSIELDVGDTKQLEVYGTRNLITEGFDITAEATYTSSDPSKVTVSAAGLITAVDETTDGSPETVTVEYKNFTTEVTVAVVDTP